MTETTPVCLHCKVSEKEMPLVQLRYQEENLYICPQHLPLLIHEPAKLIGSLPGAEKLKGYQHD